jgi:GNAT superfamily N-acetyltransferase
MEQVRIEHGRPEDAATLTRIAVAAKRHWGYPESWMERWRSELEVMPSGIEGTETYCALLGQEIVGFYRLLPKGTALELAHLWVVPAQMRKGIGRTLFQHAVGRARALGFRCFEIEADPNATGFYLRMGCVRVGNVVSEIDGFRRELPAFMYEI